MTPQVLLLPQWIATQEPVGQVLTDHAIAIDTKGVIVEIGDRAQMLNRYPNVERIERPGHLVTPGLINLHTHAAMSLLRGQGDDLPLERWLRERIWPLENKLMSPAFVYDGTVLASAEMLLNGITYFNDMYFHSDVVGQAALDMGIQARLGIAIIDLPTPATADGKDALRKGLAARDSLRGEPSLQFSLAPHAPYTVGDETLREIVTLAEELDLPVHIHLHETRKEIEDSIARYGVRPLARLHALGLLGCEMIAAHAVHLTPGEIELLARQNAHIAHCPHSNLKLASGIAPLTELMRAGVNIGIGTDGSASNNRLDMLSEIRTALLLAKGVSGDAACFNAHQALAAATIQAAQALRIDDVMGSIAVDKQADLVAWNLSHPLLQPVSDPVAQLLYSGTSEHVADVWIRGQSVVRKRQLVAQRAAGVLSEVTARIPLWHNRVGEILSAVA